MRRQCDSNAKSFYLTSEKKGISSTIESISNTRKFLQCGCLFLHSILSLSASYIKQTKKKIEYFQTKLREKFHLKSFTFHCKQQVSFRVHCRILLKLIWEERGRKVLLFLLFWLCMRLSTPKTWNDEKSKNKANTTNPFQQANNMQICRDERKVSLVSLDGEKTV